MVGVLQHPGSQFWGPAIGGSGNLVIGLYTSPLYVNTIFVIFVISSINQSINQSIILLLIRHGRTHTYTEEKYNSEYNNKLETMGLVSGSL